jgi:hypothetical protein
LLGTGRWERSFVLFDEHWGGFTAARSVAGGRALVGRQTRRPHLGEPGLHDNIDPERARGRRAQRRLRRPAPDGATNRTGQAIVNA